jgi:uncharacterized protein (DUF2384 family)
MPKRATSAVAGLAEGPVLTKAALRAAERLDVSNKILARVVGLSEASVSRMGSGAYTLSSGDKAFELAVMFVRLFRSLDALVHGDDAVAAAWMTNPNAALGGAPLELVQTVPGLVHVLAYLDARRALV